MSYRLSIVHVTTPRSEPSGCRQTGLRQAWPVRSAARTAASSTVMPSPGQLAAQGVAVDESEGFGVDDVREEVGVLVVVDAPALLLDEEVGGGERDLEAGRERDRAERAVRGEQRAVGLRERGDAVDLRDAAGVREVGLGDGDPGGECGQELGAAVEAFAGRERHRARRDEARQLVAVLGQDGLLDEQRVQWGEFGEHAAGAGWGEAAVEVDATSRPGPSASRAAATRATIAAVSAGVGIGEVAPAAFIFTAVKPASTWAVICSAELGGFVAADPGVDPDAVAHGAAEQGVHGGAVGLARRCPTAPGRGRRRRWRGPGRPGRSRPWTCTCQWSWMRNGSWPRGVRRGRRRRRGRPRRVPRRPARPSRPRPRRSRRGRTASGAGRGRSRRERSSLRARAFRLFAQRGVPPGRPLRSRRGGQVAYRLVEQRAHGRLGGVRVLARTASRTARWRAPGPRRAGSCARCWSRCARPDSRTISMRSRSSLWVAASSARWKARSASTAWAASACLAPPSRRAPPSRAARSASVRRSAASRRRPAR
jgi:hypothetical protein